MTNTYKTTVPDTNLVLRGRTSFRFLVVVFRAKDILSDGGTLVAFARVEKRSDSLDKARKIKSQQGSARLAIQARIFDTTNQVWL